MWPNNAGSNLTTLSEIDARNGKAVSDICPVICQKLLVEISTDICSLSVNETKGRTLGSLGGQVAEWSVELVSHTYCNRAGWPTRFPSPPGHGAFRSTGALVTVTRTKCGHGRVRKCEVNGAMVGNWQIGDKKKTKYYYYLGLMFSFSLW